MPTQFNHKEIYNYSTKNFIGKSEVQRLLEINDHPYEHVKELEKKKRMIGQYLESKDAYPKSNFDSTRVSGGSHSDPTANLAVDRAYYEDLFREDVTIQELLNIEEIQMPDSYRACLLLERSLLIYKEIITLFSDDLIELVLRNRLEGIKVDKMIEDNELSRSTVFRKLAKSRELIEEKIIETLEIYHLIDLNENRGDGDE